MAVKYLKPTRWVQYDLLAVVPFLVEAKASILALTQVPSQRSWAEKLQALQLKREVAGTSKIEGAEFTEQELEAALHESPEMLATRSQRQAAAAKATYTWIARIPLDRPMTPDLILEVHRRLVTGCDDDHCQPGAFRDQGSNVVFGTPLHRGVEGGHACRETFAALCEAVNTEFQKHDRLVQAIGLHYHLAAMHLFQDGNGRTSRAIEALMLRSAGLRDTAFIAMSNYYYDEKTAYLNALNETRAAGNDLTPFLIFALKGIEKQCRALFSEIRTNIAKALFRDTMVGLFQRLKTPKKRVMSKRQLEIANMLLDKGSTEFQEILRLAAHLYILKNPRLALVRDLNSLIDLGAFTIKSRVNPDGGPRQNWLDVDLDWPTKISETEFFRLTRELPKGKTLRFLPSA